eukprot:610093-Rhodomonas_salina.1
MAVLSEGYDTMTGSTELDSELSWSMALPQSVLSWVLRSGMARQDIIDSKVDKRRKGLYGPPLGYDPTIYSYVRYKYPPTLSS